VSELKTRKAKGDFAELKVACDLASRGYKIALPYEEDWNYDLIVEREGRLERIQVKYVSSDGHVAVVKCKSHSLTNGKVRAVKKYTAEMIDWLAVYDRTTDCCFYIPATELGEGRDVLSLRLTDARNNQRARIRFADDYRGFPPRIATARLDLMEPAGLEPATSSVQGTRSSN
jgi:hypothetical protein